MFLGSGLALLKSCDIGVNFISLFFVNIMSLETFLWTSFYCSYNYYPVHCASIKQNIGLFQWNIRKTATMKVRT